MTCQLSAGLLRRGLWRRWTLMLGSGDRPSTSISCRAAAFVISHSWSNAGKVVFVSKGRSALCAPQSGAARWHHQGPPWAFIKGVTDHLPKAAISFDRFHVVAHASQAVNRMRLSSTGPIQRSKVCALHLLRAKANSAPNAILDRLVVQITTKRTPASGNVAQRSAPSRLYCPRPQSVASSQSHQARRVHG
jgi:hypothetical protein